MRRDNLRSEDPRDSKKVERMIKVLMAEMVKEGYAANTAKNVSKALSSFFASQGLPIIIKAKDFPKGSARGQRLALGDHIRIMHDYSSTQFKLRNRAILLFGKDGGIRVSDMAGLNLGDWYDAETIEHASGTFKVFNFETIKMKIEALIHVGPECVEAVEKYLVKRETRGYPMDEDSPLFISSPRHPGATPGRFTADGLGQVLIRMGSKVGVKKISGHSLRKFHTTFLESGGIPSNWIKKLQGKAVESSMKPYSRPEEIVNGNGETLTDKYINAYPRLRIFGESVTAQKLDEQAQRINDLEARLEEAVLKANRTSSVEARLERLEKLLEERSP
jgi:integrase